MLSAAMARDLARFVGDLDESGRTDVLSIGSRSLSQIRCELTYYWCRRGCSEQPSPRPVSVSTKRGRGLPNGSAADGGVTSSHGGVTSSHGVDPACNLVEQTFFGFLWPFLSQIRRELGFCSCVEWRWPQLGLPDQVVARLFDHIFRCLWPKSVDMGGGTRLLLMSAGLVGPSRSVEEMIAARFC